MRALLLLILLVVVVGAGLKVAGVELPFIDYAIGPFGVGGPGGPGPGMPDIQIEPPGFDDYPAP